MKTTCNSICFAIALICAAVQPAHAGVTLDGSLGRSGTLSGPNYSITADLGKQVGTNLFHSFSQFNLVKGDVATFSGPTNISNIISRITGGSASSIDGTIRSTISGANMYLINPYGVMFGPNASIDIGGSFHVSTADYLKLGTDGRFDAATPANSILTVSPPSAFGFMGTSRTAITVKDGSTLAMKPSQAISIVAGDVEIDKGTVSTQDGGGIRLVALGRNQQEVDVTGGLPDATGELTIINGGRVASIANSAGDSGSIKVGAGNITIDGGNDFSSIYSLANSGSGNGGSIEVTATGNISVINGASMYSKSYSSGTAGNINVTADTILLDGQEYYGRIYSVANSTGKGGSLFIKAYDFITLTNDGTIAVQASRTGDAGTASIETGKLTIDNSSINGSTYGSGKGGSLFIKAYDSITLTNGGNIAVVAAPGSTGDAGTASVETGKLTIDRFYASSDYGSVISGATYGSGKGGSLSIKASDSITLTNGGSISVVAGPGSTGNAGTVSIETGKLTIDGGYTSSSGTTYGSLITGSTYSTGKGGSLSIKASDTITVTNGGFIAVLAEPDTTGDAGTASIETGKLTIGGYYTSSSGETYNSSITGSTDGSGKGGSLFIKASDSITLTNWGVISVTAVIGDAGTASIDTGKLIIDGCFTPDSGFNSGYTYRTSINGSTYGTGKGGSLFIKASDSISLTNGGAIEVQASTGSTGDAGTASIETGKLMIDGGYTSSSGSTYNSRINGSTNGSGKGGSLSIKAPEFITITNGGSVTVEAATGSTGDAGTASIETGILTIDGGITSGSDTTHSVISGSTFGTGKGGDITINTGTLNMAGTARISSESEGTGKAGDLNLKVLNAINLTDSSITTSTTNADGGNITISDLRLIDLRNSQITTSVKGGIGNGGNINIAAKQLVVDHSDIIANAEGGNGGNINLNTQALIQSVSGSTISASSRLGISGTVSISSPLVDIGAGLAAMPDTLKDINNLAPKRCATSDEEISSFSVLECSGSIMNPDRPVITP